MLEISPKGTVPILILGDKIIDESYDIVNWVIKKRNIFNENLRSDQINLTESLIKKFDEAFKHHLDRYKYATRYENSDSEFHRSECLKILIDLEAIASNGKWIFGENLNKLDISILPFIRQFRIANPGWFDSLEEISKIKKVLNNYLNSEEFKKIMFKYDEWQSGSEPIYFPST
jgi:glutathione S-transferase